MFELTGTIHSIKPTEHIKDTFRKRECVVAIKSGKDGQYTELVKLDFIQDRCDRLDDYTEGEAVRVKFDLKGREYNDKVYTNLQAYFIEREGSAPVRTTTVKAPRPAVIQADDLNQDDEVPF